MLDRRSCWLISSSVRGASGSHCLVLLPPPLYSFFFRSPSCHSMSTSPSPPFSVLTLGIRCLLRPNVGFRSNFVLDFSHSLVCQTHERYLPNCTTQWTMSNMVSMIKRNAAVNADGFGVGWYNLEVDPEPCIFTSIAPAEHNVNLARLCKKIQSHLIFGHVRAASLGSPVNDTNCHPFQFGRFLWMHNGCVANWSAVKRPITALLSACSFSYISGTTDSEIAGALFVDQLPGHNPHVEHSTQDLIDAMNLTIQILTQFVHALHVPGSGDSLVSSLNFAVSDGKTVVATRFRDSPSEEPPSLYYCKVTHMEMVANEMEIQHDPNVAPRGVVIASEPLTYQSENWTLIPKNHMIVVTNGTEVQLLPITLTSEMIHSKWISEAEAANHQSLHLGASDLNKFFGTACCSCAQKIKAPCSSLTTELGVKLNNSQGSISAPSSPPVAPHFSPNTKSAMILESPIMTGALRALLASATPSQLREILESNLLPASAPTTSTTTCSITSLAASKIIPISVAAGEASLASSGSSTVSQLLSHSTSSSSFFPLSSSMSSGSLSSSAAAVVVPGESVFNYVTVSQSLSPSSSSSRLQHSSNSVGYSSPTSNCSNSTTAVSVAHVAPNSAPSIYGKAKPNCNGGNGAISVINSSNNSSIINNITVASTAAPTTHATTLSPSTSVTTTAGLPTLTYAPPFMHRGDSPAVLQSDGSHLAGSGTFPLPVFTSLGHSMAMMLTPTKPSSTSTSQLHRSASSVSSGSSYYTPSAAPSSLGPAS